MTEMLLLVSWGGWKDGAACWGADRAWELVGDPLCPMDAEQCCSPSSALRPDPGPWVCRLSRSVSGRWNEAETYPRKQMGVVHSWERGLEVLYEIMERKRSASLKESLLSKKSLQAVTTQQTGADSSCSEATDPAAPCRVLPDKVEHLPALIFWAMLLSQCVLVSVSRCGYHPLGTFSHGDLSLKRAADLTWWP